MVMRSVPARARTFLGGRERETEGGERGGEGGGARRRRRREEKEKEKGGGGGGGRGYRWLKAGKARRGERVWQGENDNTMQT